LKKVLFFFVLIGVLFGAEFEYGKGTFSIKGGLFGLNKTVSQDIDVFAFYNHHKNILGTKFFFSYKLAFYKSKSVTNTINTYNSVVSSNTLTNSLTFDYKLQGVDANIVLGRDFYREGGDYLGVGVLLGISGPYIKSKGDDSASSDSDNVDNTLPGYGYLSDSETDFTTYKIGPSVRAQKEILSFLTVYGDAQYAYQMARVKNKEAGIDQYDSGNYLSYDIGVKLQAKAGRKKIWIISFSPKFFVTFGYRYNYWKVKNVEINGVNLIGPADLSFSVEYAYFGLGYDF